MIFPPTIIWVAKNNFQWCNPFKWHSILMWVCWVGCCLAEHHAESLSLYGARDTYVPEITPQHSPAISNSAAIKSKLFSVRSHQAVFNTRTCLYMLINVYIEKRMVIINTLGFWRKDSMAYCFYKLIALSTQLYFIPHQTSYLICLPPPLLPSS